MLDLKDDNEDSLATDDFSNEESEDIEITATSPTTIVENLEQVSGDPDTPQPDSDQDSCDEREEGLAEKIREDAAIEAMKNLVQEKVETASTTEVSEED